MTFFDMVRLLLMIAGLWLGGYAVARFALRVRDMMTLAPLSLALGLLGYILGLDVLGQLMPFGLAAWTVALAWPLASALALWRVRRHLLPLTLPADRRLWIGLAVILAALTAIHVTLALQLFVFDDPSHLHITQIIARGEFPARYQWNPDYYQGNHYGVYLLGAGGAHVTGLQSWYALDLFTALIGTVAPWLAFAYGYRLTGSVWAGLAGAFLFYTASGARWLGLPFLPPEGSADLWLGVYDPHVYRFGLDSNQLLQFPFIFRSGNYSPFLLVMHTKVQAAGWLAALTLLVIGTLHEAARAWRSLAFGVVLGMFGLLYLTHPLSIGPGLILAWLVGFLTERDAAAREALFPLDLRVVVPVALVLFAALGGYPTDRLIGGPGAFGPSGQSNAMSLTWRGQIALPNFDLQQAVPLIGTPLPFFLFELGFALLWLPVAAWGIWRKYPAQRWVLFSSVAGVLAMMLFGIPGSVWDPDTVRIGSLGFPLWAMLGGIVAVGWIGRQDAPLPAGGEGHSTAPASGGRAGPGLPSLAAGRWPLAAVSFGIALTSLSGVLLLLSMLTRLTGVVRPTHYIDPVDEAMLVYQEAVPPGSLLFDATDFRPGATVFGAYTRHITSRQDHLIRREEFLQQREAPTLESLRADGYQFVYVMRAWYEGLSSESRAVLDGPGLALIGQAVDEESGDWRRLLRLCDPAEDCPGAGPPDVG